MTELYRAIPVSQRDGSALANSNCRMAAIATGIDYHTGGARTSTGSEMRARQSDQSGGTDSGDASEAWQSYGQDLRIRDGASFPDALSDLHAGRLVHLDVWAADCAGPCCDSECGHTIAVAPERSGTRWLTADPWCSPAKWTWWEEALLQRGAETWGGQVYGAATAGLRWTGDERALKALMRLAAKRLMGLYRPDFPAAIRPYADTEGSGGRIMFTTTAAPTVAPPPGTTGDDVMYNVAPLTTHRSAIVRNCADLFADSSLTSPVDIGSEGQPLGFAGSTADAHLVVKGDTVLYVRRTDVVEIITADTEYA